jgi:hypothetical protein
MANKTEKNNIVKTVSNIIAEDLKYNFEVDESNVSKVCFENCLEFWNDASAQTQSFFENHKDFIRSIVRYMNLHLNIGYQIRC